MKSYNSPNNDPLFLIASGAAKDTPFLKSWQIFKDSIRESIPGHPKRVEVAQSRSQYRMNQGWVELENQEDGESGFQVYSKINGVHVHLIKSNKDQIQVLQCNCASATPARQCIDIIHAHYVPAHLPTNVTNTGLSYAPNSFGLPVNVTHGVIMAESRRVFFQNLSYNCTLHDFNMLLLTIANPISCKFNQNRRTGAFNGCATALFSTQDDAARVVFQLDGKEYTGRILGARLDKETEALQHSKGPLIVSSNILKKGYA